MLELLSANLHSSEQSELGMGRAGSSFFVHHAPDPVNNRTLNFYLPVDVMSLPCYVPIDIKAAYNSYAGDSSIFGEKWTFNYNVTIRQTKTEFIVLEGDGFANNYTREKNLEEVKKAKIEQILIARKKADSQSGGGLKANTVYEDFKRQLNENPALLEEQEGKWIKTAKPLSPGIYYSFARGASTLEYRPDHTFVRRFSTGAYELFDKQGRLIKTADRNGNFLNFLYDAKNLVRIEDMCGRSMSFTYKSEKALAGLVDSITDSIGRKVKFEFFPNRRLKSFYNGVSIFTEYEYDKIGNMTSLATTTKDDSGLPQHEKLKFEYNSIYEVVKQIGPDTQETRYKRTYVANNKSHSITEITTFDEGKLTGRELHEFKGNESESVTKFDATGKEVKKETRKLSQTTGFPVSILNGKGQGELFEYDKDGNLLKRQSVPAGEILEFGYDTRCKQANYLKTTRPKQPPTESTFKFDAQCNVFDASEMNAGKKTIWIEIVWNKQGRPLFLNDKLKSKSVGFTYWTYGKPESITLKDVGTLLVKYHPDGEIDRVDTFPHGAGKEKFKKLDKAAGQTKILAEVRATLDGMLNYLKPAGLNIGL